MSHAVFLLLRFYVLFIAFYDFPTLLISISTPVLGPHKIIQHILCVYIQCPTSSFVEMARKMSHTADQYDFYIGFVKIP